MLLGRAFILAILSLFLLGDASETDETEPDLVHSDVPLWDVDSGRLWPQYFSNSEGWGCIHNIRLGDWQLDEGEYGTTWFRLANYGAFHCFLLVQQAGHRNELEAREAAFSYLVSLGTVPTNHGVRNLWALQKGGRPGSDYLFLTSAPGTGQIAEFDVLQRECPDRYVRTGPSLDILITRYCAINSRGEMERLARRMARLPPLGRMTYVPAEQD